MKGKIITALAAVLLWTQFGVPGEVHAWKPKPPFCYQTGSTCGVPVGNISASPVTVYLTSDSAIGSTQLKWTWDFVSGGASFQLACIYVGANNNTQWKVVQCEWPGNKYTTNIPWIGVGSATFMLSPYVGDVVATISPLAGTSYVVVKGEVR